MRDEVRLAISRHAARLFLERGVRGTSGDDIAAAAGLSTRTLWRYFRNKESCAEPLFAESALRLTAKLREWPRNLAIEDFLQLRFGLEERTPEEIADDIVANRLIAIMADEPALRAAWLMSAQVAEEELIEIIADRLERSVKDAEVRLCAATVTAAIRVLSETISIATVRHGQTFTRDAIIDRLGRAIRAASTLPICDPVVF
jgi:AcrR family transcriptional regulator